MSGEWGTGGDEWGQGGGGGGGDGDGDVSDFPRSGAVTWQPGGVTGGWIYATFAEAVTALQALARPRYLYIDTSLTPSPTIPAGTYDMAGVRVSACTICTGDIEINVAEGVEFLNLRHVADSTTLNFLGDTPPIQDLVANDTMLLERGATLTVSGTGPFVRIPNGTMIDPEDRISIVVRVTGGLRVGSAPIVDFLDTTGRLEFLAFDGFVEANTVASDVGTTISVIRIAPVATVAVTPSEQSGALGTIEQELLTSAETVGVFSVPGINTVQDVINTIATAGALNEYEVDFETVLAQDMKITPTVEIEGVTWTAENTGAVAATFAFDGSTGLTMASSLQGDYYGTTRTCPIFRARIVDMLSGYRAGSRFAAMVQVDKGTLNQEVEQVGMMIERDPAVPDAGTGHVGAVCVYLSGSPRWLGRTLTSTTNNAGQDVILAAPTTDTGHDVLHLEVTDSGDVHVRTGTYSGGWPSVSSMTYRGVVRQALNYINAAASIGDQARVALIVANGGFIRNVSAVFKRVRLEQYA